MTFSAGVNKQDQKVLTASMSVFAAVLMRGRYLAGSTAAWGAVITKLVGIVLSGVTAACTGAIMRGRILGAATVAMAGGITRQMFMVLTAVTVACSASLASAHLALLNFTASTVALGATVVKQVQKFFSAS